MIYGKGEHGYICGGKRMVVLIESRGHSQREWDKTSVLRMVG